MAGLFGMGATHTENLFHLHSQTASPSSRPQGRRSNVRGEQGVTEGLLEFDSSYWMASIRSKRGEYRGGYERQQKRYPRNNTSRSTSSTEAQRLCVGFDQEFRNLLPVPHWLYFAVSLQPLCDDVTEVQMSRGIRSLWREAVGAHKEITPRRAPPHWSKHSGTACHSWDTALALLLLFLLR